MTEWKPIIGSIPPLNSIEWNEAFDKYKAFPEFQLKKSDMKLSGFKFIFFWEYFHRVLGRIIGLVFFFPFMYLLIRKRLNGYWSSRFLLGLILGGSQGLLGWYMVKSGLADRPDVSHFRLAAHFSLALLIMVYLYILLLKLKFNSKLFMKRKIPFFKSFIGLLIIQIVYGAFVAGLDAGVGYNTFPLMGESFIPKGLLAGQFLHKIIDTTVGVQFVHRVLGFGLLAFGIYYFYKSIFLRTMRSKLFPISLMIFVQFLLGVSTLILKVPVGMASMHQMGACFLVLLVTRAYFYQENKIS
jgi:cytochrome c oxidase assembly protein subunit 15